jgi:hypothetical protein
MNDQSLLPCTDDAAAVEAAEAYVLQHLPVNEFESYEEHLLVCQRCQQAVAEFDLFLSAAREALSEYPRRHRRASNGRAKSASC